MLKHDYTLTCAGAVDRLTGQIYINPKIFYPLTSFEKKFVLLHEEAHYVLNTDSERRCDAYAFDRLAGSELRSLKKSVATLENLLSDGNPAKAERIWSIYVRALKWDARRGNKYAALELRQIGKKPARSYFERTSRTEVSHDGEPGWSYKCEFQKTGIFGWGSGRTVCNWEFDSQKAATEMEIIAQAKDQESLTSAREDMIDAQIEENYNNDSESQLDSNTTTILIIIALICLIW